MQTLHKIIAKQARAAPGSVAVTCGDQSLTYGELNERANALANALLAAGVSGNALVGLCLDRSIDLLVGILGILKAGAAYVPLDPAYPTDRLAHVLDQAAPEFIVSRGDVGAVLPDSGARLIDVDAGRDAVDPRVACSGDDLCYVIFTSGTTGRPKGVMVSHANVARLFPAINDSMGFSADDVWTLFHSYAFGFSAWEIFGALLHGGRLVVVPDRDRADPQALYELLKSETVTVLSQTPSAFRQLLLNDTFAGSDTELALRLIVFSGEALQAGDLQSWYAQHKAGPQLVNTFAITETGGQVTMRQYSPADAADPQSANIGRPLADTPVWVTDAEARTVTPGETGELCIGGPGIARGYLNEAELTAQAFPELDLPDGRQRVYRSGDRARQLADGSIEFVGRDDGQIKIRGYRIEPGDIENALTRHPDIREAAVVARAEGDGQRLIAYVVTSPGASLSSTRLREHAAKALPDYMLPAVYVQLAALPLTPNGKTDKAALPLPGSARPDLGVAYVAPEGHLQTRLAGIWSDALGVEGIGADDNFFELGGDSILALKLTTGIRELLGEYIYISALLDAPTIAGLAKALQDMHPEAVAALDSGATREPADEALPVVMPDHNACFEPFPLTDIQQAYLVGRGGDFAMGNVSTHLYIEVDAVDIDLPRLEQAWQKVIDRHPMLRAVVHPDGTQQVLPDVPAYRFPVQDLRSASTAEVEAGLAAERERLSHQVIPSDRWPLFELSATLLPEARTRLHISLDCLITDARSFQIMSAEWLRFYHDPDAVLPLPNLSFRDYVLTERTLRESGFYQRSLDYWRQRIETLPAMPQLPLARAPETLQRQHFVQRGCELPRADWERFQARAARAGVTPTVALLQCFGEALAAWSRTPRLTLNLTLFNRLPLHPDVNDVVGDFTSLVLLGVAELDDGSFEQRAQRLQKELWQGVDNRFVSGVRVMREIAQMGDRIQPMMPIVFTSILGVGAGGQDDSSWHRLGKQVYSVSQTPQVWIDHVAMERNGALFYTWDVVEELFPDGMIDDLFAAYSKRLRELAGSDADAESAWQLDWPATLTGLLPQAQAAVRAAANDTAAPEPAQLLHTPFIVQAAAHPDAAAVIASDFSLSYGELDRMSNQVANALVDRGVQTNELVAVVMQKGWEQVVAVLGILKAGAAYMPVDAAMPAERLHYLLDFGQARIALTQNCQDAAIDWPENVERIRVSTAGLAELPDSAVTATTQLDDIAYVIFTSGSTGQPKGVVIDHRGAANTCIDVNQRFGVGPRDRVLALSSLSFDLSVYDIFGLLGAGGAIVMPDAGGMRDPAHWATLVARHQVTIWNTVPALMDLLTDYAERQPEPVLQSLRVVMMSGDWIPVKLPDRIRALGTIDVYSLGGATEASIWSIIYPVGTVPENWTSIPYGKPMLNQTFHVLSPDLTPCPDWVPGELCIGGIGVAKGYWRDDEKTAASFFTHPRSGERLYRTGDLGRYLPDGNIEFMGREDFQVKVQGFRVELGDIEAALESHPHLRNAVVVASGPDRGNKRLIAYVVPEQEPHPGADELKQYLGGKLPEYMVPSAFVMLDHLPLTANGKVDRRELPEPPAADTASSTTGSATPSHSAASDIARIVSEVLNADGLDPAANLLQLGATSIEMIRIANALDQHLGFRPRMDEFYREPSINGLAQLLDAAKPASAALDAVAGGDPLTTPGWLLDGIPKLVDPDERRRFKDSRPGLRRLETAASFALPDTPADPADYERHRSYREFAEAPVSAAALAELLGALRSMQIHDQPKYLYASAGGMYPVQCYLYVKPEGVAGIAAGFYYYDPEAHQLVSIGPEDSTLRQQYDPIVNRPIYDGAAFALYLVADLAAIGAMYRERALHYATLETGQITQILEMRGPSLGIGLCQTGGLETEVLRSHLALGAHHLVLHGLLGGGLPADVTGSPRGEAAESATTTVASGERDEGEV